MIPVVEKISEMRQLAEQTRRQGGRIALTPTMGYLHEGHLSLAREGRLGAKLNVMSIFVNPKQFCPGEDLDCYPRDPQGDNLKAEEAGVDVIFQPSPDAIYPKGFQTYVEVRELTEGLCGDHRPGHFLGVTTVCAKLFNIVRPDRAIFGEKDYQQLQVIRRMVKDLNMGIEIVGMPILREDDGLAMSSRNAYLSLDARIRALCLHQALCRAKSLAGAGETSIAALQDEMAAIIEAAKGKTDYIELRDTETLESLESLDRPAVAALAVYIDQCRLIDNMRIFPPVPTM